jgi:hypothetical protein
MILPFSFAAVAGEVRGLFSPGGGGRQMFADVLRAFGKAPVIPHSGQGLLGQAATRRMCAGTYLDRAFRDELLRGVYNDRTRRVAPSFGFDVVIVLHHAWRAWWLEFWQRSALVVVLALALVQVPLDTLIAASAIVIWHLVRFLPGWAGGIRRYYYRGEGAEPDIRQMKTRGKLLGAGLLTSFLTLVTAMILAARDSRRAGALGAAWTTRTGLAGAAEILAACAVTVAAVATVRMMWIRQLRNQDPSRPRRLGHRMGVIDAQQHHPLTVHSGFSPFIGSGINVRSWSFAQRLIRHKGTGTEPDQEYDTPPFTSENLISRLHEKISDLREDDHHETRLPGLDIGHHVFVEGTHAAPFRSILRDTHDSPGVKKAMIKAIARPSDLARHYLASRVASWGGEVVTSVYVHVSLQGRTLYLEFATYALLPTRTDYHAVDEPAKTGARALAKSIAKSVLSLPEELLAPRYMATAPAQLWAAVRPRKDLTARKRASSRADIGAMVSARESAATDAEESYFQFQDSLQHSKIIERRLIATVGDYLKELGVDTSEFWERARAILNNGVIINASAVTIGGNVIGEQTNVTSDATTAEDQASNQQ